MKARSVFAALALIALVAGCGAPGDDDDDAAQSTPAATAAAKPDISKAGNVTLTSGTRRSAAARRRRSRSSASSSRRSTRTSRSSGSRSPSRTLVKTVKLAASGPNAPDVLQANQGRPIMGELVKAKLLRPVADYAKVYGWADR